MAWGCSEEDAFADRWVLALFCLATVARSQTPVTYVGSTGETFALYAYEGERTALLVD